MPPFAQGRSPPRSRAQISLTASTVIFLLKAARALPSVHPREPPKRPCTAGSHSCSIRCVSPICTQCQTTWHCRRSSLQPREQAGVERQAGCHPGLPRCHGAGCQRIQCGRPGVKSPDMQENNGGLQGKCHGAHSQPGGSPHYHPSPHPLPNASGSSDNEVVEGPKDALGVSLRCVAWNGGCSAQG